MEGSIITRDKRININILLKPCLTSGKLSIKIIEGSDNETVFIINNFISNHYNEPFIDKNAEKNYCLETNPSPFTSNI
jgi:hypothetical protein